MIRISVGLFVGDMWRVRVGDNFTEGTLAHKNKALQ
jgi:hypothetical protein